MIGISTDDYRDRAQAFLSQAHTSFPRYIDANLVLENILGGDRCPLALAKDKGIWLMQALGNSRAGLPFTVTFDRKGEIVMRKLGAMTAADIDAAASTLLKSSRN